MERSWIGIVMGGALVGLTASPVLAYHCPALIKECQTTADVVANRPGTDKAAVEKARQGCDEASPGRQAQRVDGQGGRHDRGAQQSASVDVGSA